MGILCTVGYGWLYYYITNTQQHKHTIEICIVKRTANIPCPACGSTRAIAALVQGNVLQSILLNPFGILIAIALLIVPIWLIVDIITSRTGLFSFYNKCEAIVRKPGIAILLALLVIINWIWNIKKGL